MYATIRCVREMAKILVVDDEEDIRNLGRIMLE
jgi:hypothetical protein